jgi:hypothetical protein
MKRKIFWNKAYPVSKTANQRLHSQLIGSGSVVKFFSDMFDGFTRFAKQSIIYNRAFRIGNIHRVSFGFGTF